MYYAVYVSFVYHVEQDNVICGCALFLDRASHPYLCDQYICHSVDGVVPLNGRDEAFSPAFFKTGQEICVELQKVFKTREQAVQPS